MKSLIYLCIFFRSAMQPSTFSYIFTITSCALLVSSFPTDQNSQIQEDLQSYDRSDNQNLALQDAVMQKRTQNTDLHDQVNQNADKRAGIFRCQGWGPGCVRVSSFRGRTYNSYNGRNSASTRGYARKPSFTLTSGESSLC